LQFKKTHSLDGINWAVGMMQSTGLLDRCKLRDQEAALCKRCLGTEHGVRFAVTCMLIVDAYDY